MTNAEARFNKSLRPRKPQGSLGWIAQDVHLDSHTVPELCGHPGVFLKTPGVKAAGLCHSLSSSKYWRDSRGLADKRQVGLSSSVTTKVTSVLPMAVSSGTSLM